MFNRKEIEYMYNDMASTTIKEMIHNAKINIPVTKALNCPNSDDSFSLFIDFRVELFTQYSMMIDKDIHADIHEFYGSENKVITLTFECGENVKQISVIRKPEAKFVTVYLKIFE